MAKYVAKIPIGGNSFRYFYSAEEYGAFKAQKNKASAAVKLKKSKLKKKKSSGDKIPSGHIATASAGRVVSGYNGTGKPENMSDEAWARYKKLWSATTTVQPKKKWKTVLKTGVASAFVRRKSK